jgi:type IV secretory pathway VirB3-like protein
MRALIERQLYQPAIVLPMLVLMRLMVTLDFNLAQVTLVVFAKGSQYVFKAVFRQRAPRTESRAVCRHCHC